MLTKNVTTPHRLEHTILDVCSTKKRAARDSSLECLGYGMLLSRTCALTSKTIIRKKHEMVMPKRKLSKKVYGGENVEIG